MKKINPHAKMAILLGLFLGGIIFTAIYLITEGERILFAAVLGLVPLVLLLSLITDFFDPGPPE